MTHHDLTDLDEAILERLHMGLPAIGPLREAQASLVAAYEAYLEAQMRECGASYTTGPDWDPYGTSCDLDAGHAGPHEGLDPLPMTDGDRIQWSGGGILPYRDVKRIPANHEAA